MSRAIPRGAPGHIYHSPGGPDDAAAALTADRRGRRPRGAARGGAPPGQPGARARAPRDRGAARAAAPRCRGALRADGRGEPRAAHAADRDRGVPPPAARSGRGPAEREAAQVPRGEPPELPAAREPAREHARGFALGERRGGPRARSRAARARDRGGDRDVRAPARGARAAPRRGARSRSGRGAVRSAARRTGAREPGRECREVHARQRSDRDHDARGGDAGACLGAPLGGDQRFRRRSRRGVRGQRTRLRALRAARARPRSGWSRARARHLPPSRRGARRRDPARRARRRRLPVLLHAARGAAEPDGRSGARVSREATAPRHRVLVVDDAEGIRAFVANWLEVEGYEVDTAEDGRRALALLEGGAAPDAILLDVMLPGIDGIETLRRIRALDERVPVVMLSVVGKASTIVEAMRLGAADYLNKPFDDLVLRATLEKVLERRSLERERDRLAREVTPSPDAVIWGSDAM